MRATGMFTVSALVPAGTPEPPGGPLPATGVPVGLVTMEKRYEGEVAGRSATLLTSAFDLAAGNGTYLALESFEGSLGGRGGTFAFVHSTPMARARGGTDFFAIVPGSGTGGLAGITGTGALDVEEDGTHHMTFDYELA